MNAPVYPKSLVGTTIYYIETEEGEYNSETEEYDEDVTVTPGTILGISLDNDGDFFFLAEKADGTLESWISSMCSTMEPEVAR